MIENINKSLYGKHTIDIGSFYFYKNFVIGKVKEGLDLNFESGKKLYELIKQYYKSSIPFVYISDRINSYSFKPTRIYGSQDYFPNLKGYAIVTYNSLNYKVAKLEETFTNMPTYIAENLDDAICWSEKLVSKS